MTFALLIAAFAMGFFGSPHCLGMCGGIVTAFGLSMQELSPSKRRALIAIYHVGRLLSYSILGIIAGLIGTALLQPLMVGNSTPRILLGLVLVFIGLSMLGLPFLNKLERVGMRFWQWLSPLRQKVFPLTTFPRALGAGLLWGFLPCGLVYGALMMAVVGHGVISGAVLMFVFGLGTVPMLVATQETVGWLQQQIGKLRLRQLNGAIMMLSGIAVIAIPVAMSSLHSGHGGHGDHASHSMDATAHAAHDMSTADAATMTHTMDHATDHNTAGNMDDSMSHDQHSSHEHTDASHSNDAHSEHSEHQHH